MTIMYLSAKHVLIFFREFTQLCASSMTLFFLVKTLLVLVSASIVEGGRFFVPGCSVLK